MTLPAARSGVATAVVLGVGRAIGEAMAIIMVAGNVANMPGLFTSVRFLTTAIASEMSYASVGSLQRQALFSIGLVLFLFIMLINVLLLFVGCFMDTTPAMLILAPILMPIATGFGFDIIHFGIIMVVNLAIGFITPPLGINLFVAARVGDEPLGTVIKGIVPFILIMLFDLVLITLILSYITLVFGELVPKRLAMKKAEALSLALSGLITFISKLFAPIVWLLTVSTNGLLRLLGIDPNAEDNEVSEEEIRMLVDSGSEKGVIDSEESEMIQNVFEFDDLTVGEIVTHRTEIAFLWNDESIEEWDKTIKSTSYSFYPICEDSIDNIIGVLNAKVYLRLTDLSRENVMKEAVREVFFVPESMKADTLFRSMKKNRNNFAVVLDEYGGTHGIVTMSDLLVQIVGEFDDEDTEEDITQVGENAWRINCRAEIEKLERLFDIEIDTESATVGGWVVEQFEDIPNEGSTLVYDDSFSIEVTKTDNKRVQEVIVRAIEKPKETEEGKD
mgnify:CR=1 FL=1